jgi:hypothetical protein
MKKKQKHTIIDQIYLFRLTDSFMLKSYQLEKAWKKLYDLSKTSASSYMLKNFSKKFFADSKNIASFSQSLLDFHQSDHLLLGDEKTLRSKKEKKIFWTKADFEATQLTFWASAFLFLRFMDFHADLININKQKLSGEKKAQAVNACLVQHHAWEMIEDMKIFMNQFANKPPASLKAHEEKLFSWFFDSKQNKKLGFACAPNQKIFRFDTFKDCDDFINQLDAHCLSIIQIMNRCIIDNNRIQTLHQAIVEAQKNLFFENAA